MAAGFKTDSSSALHGSLQQARFPHSLILYLTMAVRCLKQLPDKWRSERSGSTGDIVLLLLPSRFLDLNPTLSYVGLCFAKIDAHALKSLVWNGMLG
jgi:hypothetical protein